MERWVEIPPPKYLQFIETWVQLRNIPVNHNTLTTITAFGEFSGQVIEVAFDREKMQNMEYVRVKVKLDVSKPVRRSKVVKLLTGETMKIIYDFERIYRRCYSCQRLTHDQDICPYLVEQKDLAKGKESADTNHGKKVNHGLLTKNDHLFRVLNEYQVGLDPLTGRPRIATTVLEGINSTS